MLPTCFSIRDINDGFRSVINEIDLRIQEKALLEEQTRNGKVWSFEAPVCITYKLPLLKVLFNDARDCNPFFHLYEAMWMLQGSNSLSQLLPFNKRMADFSDDGVKLHGAYGYRWKNMFNVDQVAMVINELRSNPSTRRAVISMWSPYDDLPRISQGKDVPCNTQVFFRVVNQSLNMTVTNRSNDLIWGCLGANYVHFSFLLEYVAACSQLPVGFYHQFSNNLHVYEWNWKPKVWLDGFDHYTYLYNNKANWLPLAVGGETKNQLDVDIRNCVENPLRPYSEYKTVFGREILRPVFESYRLYKESGASKALNYLESNKATWDWTLAAYYWIRRRELRKVVSHYKKSFASDSGFSKEDPHVNCNDDVE